MHGGEGVQHQRAGGLQGSKPVVVTLSQHPGPHGSLCGSLRISAWALLHRSHRLRCSLAGPQPGLQKSAIHVTMKAPGLGKASREMLGVARSPVAHEA